METYSRVEVIGTDGNMIIREMPKVIWGMYNEELKKNPDKQTLSERLEILNNLAEANPQYFRKNRS